MTARVEVYCAFPDGGLDYVCSECPALCCRGQGIGVDSSRLHELLEHYPALSCVSIGQCDELVSFTTPSGRC